MDKPHLVEAESNKNGAHSVPFLELSVIICHLGIVSVTETHTRVSGGQCHMSHSHTITILATLLINQSARICWDATQNTKGTYSLHEKISFLNEHEKRVLIHPVFAKSLVNREGYL